MAQYFNTLFLHLVVFFFHGSENKFKGIMLYQHIFFTRLILKTAERNLLPRKLYEIVCTWMIDVIVMDFNFELIELSGKLNFNIVTSQWWQWKFYLCKRFIFKEVLYYIANSNIPSLIIYTVLEKRTELPSFTFTFTANSGRVQFSSRASSSIFLG